MKKKRVLIITYYWPPAGGPGVQRWLKFVKYLPDFDIEPIVFCPENPSYPITDKSLETEIPSDIKIIKHPIREPYRWAKLFSKKSTKSLSSGLIPDKKKQSMIQKLLLSIRGNFFIPDARIHWVKPSVSYLKSFIKDEKIDTLITTGPPHSVHLIGYHLKQNNAVTWLTDFRDPWTTIGYHKNLNLSQKSINKHLQLESQVLNASDHIITTSHATKREFLTKTNTPISVITNGYDKHSVKIAKKDTLFSIAHIGSLLSERNPEFLWECLSELVKENSDFKKCFQLNLVGIVSNSVIQSINEYGLNEYLNLVGYVSHQEAIAYQLKSQVLLLIEIDSEDTKAIIPGKLFEYLISKTPILALGPEQSDVENIIKTTNTGLYFYYNQKDELKYQLLSYFSMYRNGEIETAPIGIEQYSRKALTKQLAQILSK